MTKQRIDWRKVESPPLVPWSRHTSERVKKQNTKTNTETTQPIPLFLMRMQQAQWHKPTIAQLRQVCGMSQYELAKASGVRYCRVAWIESGIRSPRAEVDKVLAFFSDQLRVQYRIEDCQGTKVEL